MSRERKTEDDVEQLLRAAQDDVMLSLTLDSHTTRAAAYSIDPDLDRRYQALKAHQDSKSTTTPATAAATEGRKIDETEEEGDLFARFAALKKSIPSHNNIESTDFSKTIEESDGDDDAVEKVIKWAVDAARLDPSSCTTSDEETDEEVEIHKRKGKKKK